jgi:uncharacterized protein YdaU (DUF1376 family)
MKIRYVQLESEAFLLDSDFIRMNAQERGVYCTLLFHLYCNNGWSELDPPTLARMCNCSDTDFEKVWQNIAKKFQARNSVIKHKRVTKELRRSKKLLQSQRKAGLASARKRLTPVATPAETPLQPTKDNEIESQRNEIEREEKVISNSNTNSINQTLSFSTSPRMVPNPAATRIASDGQIQSLHFNGALCQIIRPRSQSDRTCFRNVTNWLTAGVATSRFTQEIFAQVLDYAKEAQKGRNPAAVFITLLQKELGYRSSPI